LIRFKKKGDYWETFEYKQSDLTDFLGLPWDLVREKTMLDHFGHTHPKEYMTKYWEKFWISFNKKLEDSELDKKLVEMKDK
jgi:hypothetical protein